MSSSSTEARKDEHIRINLEEDVSFGDVTTGLESYRFEHKALPELDLDEVDTTTVFFGHEFAFPLLMGSMTGGTPLSGSINRTLARVAQEVGIGMGLGSTRALLERPAVIESYKVRDIAPDVFLAANLGAVQLNYGYTVDDCRRLVDLTQANALYLHLNPLQEALQPEGDTRFSGLLARITQVCRTLEAPVIVKEVGWGLSAQVARQLVEAGVAALDVAGAGGTSWSQVERFRQIDVQGQEVAASFQGWGIPTATSLRQARSVAPQIPLVASGGLRTGIDIAKCIALGADLTSLAGAILRPASESTVALSGHIQLLHRQLRIAMFVVGAGSIAALKHAELVYT